MILQFMKSCMTDLIVQVLSYDYSATVQLMNIKHNFSTKLKSYLIRQLCRYIFSQRGCPY